LQAEKRSWDDLIASTTTDPKANPHLSEPLQLEPKRIDTTLLDPSQAEILHHLFPLPPPNATKTPEERPDTLSSTQSRLDALSQTLEFKIDLFADSLHRLEQYRQGADRAAGKILAAGAQRLEERDEERREKNGGMVDGMDMLRALSRAANGR